LFRFVSFFISFVLFYSGIDISQSHFSAGLAYHLSLSTVHFRSYFLHSRACISLLLSFLLALKYDDPSVSNPPFFRPAFNSLASISQSVPPTTQTPLSPPPIPISNPIIPPSLPPTGILLPTLHPTFSTAISLCPFSRSASVRLIVGGKGWVGWRERVRGMVFSGCWWWWWWW
jgi:hypothetical protein